MALSEVLRLSETPKCLKIYTDGSHIKNKTNGYIGYGAYCLFNGTEYHLSKTITPELLIRYGITTTEISNPTAEFLAFSEVLTKFANTGFHTFCFYIDYIGVNKWLSGEWKAKKPYILKIRNYCLNLMNKYNMSVSINHVKAHSGDKGNEIADYLAKQRTDVDEF